MGPFWIKWVLTLFFLLARPAKGNPSVLPVLNYPANPSYVQAHGHYFPISSSPTTFTTQTLGVPVLTSQSSFFVKSLPALNTATPILPGSPVSATPLIPFPTAQATPLLPLPRAPATPLVPYPSPPPTLFPLPSPPAPTFVPLPSPPASLPSAPANPFLPLPPASTPNVPQPPTRSVPVPALVIYTDGSVVPLSDTHYKFPPVIEGFINRVQNYFSNYVHIDPNSVPFPIKNQKPSNLADNSSTAAITTTTTTTTTAKTFGPAINLRLVTLPTNQQSQPTAGFARTSTVPTSTGRTAKLVEVFRPNGQLSESLVQSNDDNQIPLAIATATATVNLDGSNSNSPGSEFGSNPPPSNRPFIPLPNTPSQPPNQSSQPPNQPNRPPSRPNQLPNRPNQPHRPRPQKPKPGSHPEPPPSQGYRYDKPEFRPLEYGDVPPRPEAYRFNGHF